MELHSPVRTTSSFMATSSRYLVTENTKSLHVEVDGSETKSGSASLSIAMRDSEVLATAERHARSMESDVQLDPHVQRTAAGYVVHGQQQHRGLSLYPHSFVLRIDDEGRVSTAGDDIVELD